MTYHLAPAPTANGPAAVHELCDLLLQVAGRDTNRLISVQRHVRVLDTALAHMNQAQAELASERIRRFETKWGPLLPASQKVPENDEIPPEMRVANWLAVRRNPERLLKVLYRTAVCVWDGEMRLRNIYEKAYADETDRVLPIVGYDSYKEWMLQLRIARHEPGGVYRPGRLCRWWVKEMEPTTRKDTPYAACLRLLVHIKKSRW